MISTRARSARRRRAEVEDAAAAALRRYGDQGATQSPGQGVSQGDVAPAGAWTGDPAHRRLCDELAGALADPALTEALAACARPRRPSSARRAGRVSGQGVAWTRAGLAGMAAAVLAGVAAWWAYGPDLAPARHFETRRGQELSLRLADGSRLQMNGVTSLDVQLGRRRRTVALHHGQAFFDVAHQSGRPFEVTTEGSRTVVLGTAFDLDVSGDTVELSVYRGRVRFGATGGSREEAIVPAGRRVAIQGGRLQPLYPFDVSQQDWRDGWLDTDGIGLARLVEELDRRAGPYVSVQDPRIARIRISGRFRLDDPAQLLPVLGQAYGFRVQRSGRGLLLRP